MTGAVDFLPEPWQAVSMLRNIAVPVLPNLSPFELGVLCEVFGIDRTEQGVPAFEFAVCAERPGEPLRALTGFTLVADHGFDRLAEADLIAVPAVEEGSYPEALLQALRDAVARGARVMSVCSGAFVLAAAGVLDGRRATTHWFHADRLAELYPEVEVELDVLYVEDGPVLTSAGTAAGIDACLHLVRRELGSEVATRIARRMVVPPHRSGGQRQYVETPLPAEPCEGLEDVMEWVAERLDEEHSIPSLARRAAMSERTFARRFTAEVGTTPHRWLTSQRVLRARHLLETTDLDIERIARESGFATAAVLRHHFQREIGVPPITYRRAFTKQPASA